MKLKLLFWIIVLSLFFIYNTNYVSALFNQTNIDNNTLIYAFSGRNVTFDGSRYNTTNGSVQGAVTFGNDAGARFSGSTPDTVNFTGSSPTTADPTINVKQSFLAVHWYCGPKTAPTDVAVFWSMQSSNSLPCPGGIASRFRTAARWQINYCLTAAEALLNIGQDAGADAHWLDNQDCVLMWVHVNRSGTTIEIGMGVNGTGQYGTTGLEVGRGTGTLGDSTHNSGANRNLILGRYPDTTATMNGNISHLYIYNITDNAQFNLTQALNYTYNNGVRRNLTTYTQAGIAPPVPDTTIPNITNANLSGNRRINESDPFCFDPRCILPQTNDTTPTFIVTTNENANVTVINLNRNINYTAIYQGTTNNGNGTGQYLSTTLNDTNVSRVGIQNFSLSAVDTSGNENRTASLFFTVNITDPSPPNVTIFAPANNSFLRVGINFTLGDIMIFNWSANDTVDNNLRNCSFYFNGVLNHSIYQYQNGSRVQTNISITDTGTNLKWYVNCTDQYNNRGDSEFRLLTIAEQQFTPNITIRLNGSSADRKFELNTTLIDKDYMIPFNMTVSPNITVCITFDIYVNHTCLPGNSTYNFNISELNETRFVGGNFTFNMSAPRRNVSIYIDNNTELRRVAFKIIGYPDSSGNFPVNVTIRLRNQSKEDIIIPGKVRDNEVEINEFKTTLGPNRRAQNFSFTTASSTSIVVNASSYLLLKNFTMAVSGYSLDIANEFSKEFRLNLTETFNTTLTNGTNATLGTWEDFTVNNSKWSSVSTGCTDSIIYQTVGGDRVLTYTCSAGSGFLQYSDVVADLRNTSTINALFTFSQSPGSTRGKVRVSDGTSHITLSQGGFDPETVNFTMKRISDNDKTWSINTNASSWSSGTADLSSLDFEKQISINFQVASGGTESGTFDINEIRWGGIWLNRFTRNGTFNFNGNFTSLIINTTPTNVSRAILTWTAAEPTGTKVLGYLANTCNTSDSEQVPRFESVLNGIVNVFGTTGNSICVRFELNSTVNTSSPVVRRYKVDVVKGSSRNVSVDFGSDGDVDWNFPFELNTTTSPRIVNGSLVDFITYRTDNCLTTPICQYPVSIILGSAGLLSVDLLNMTQRIVSELNQSGEIVLRNLTEVDSVTYNNWTTSFLGGFLALFDLDVEFKGSKNFTVSARNYLNGTFLLNESNLTIQIVYSKFNVTFPKSITTFELAPKSNNQTNITVVGQEFNQCNVSVDYYCAHTSTPIFNLTNLAYDDNFDIYVRFNQSYNTTFLNFSIDIGVNRTTPLQINNSFQRFFDNIARFEINPNNSRRIFAFVDFYNVSLENLSLDLEWEWRPYCTGCVR